MKCYTKLVLFRLSFFFHFFDLVSIIQSSLGMTHDRRVNQDWNRSDYTSTRTIQRDSNVLPSWKTFHVKGSSSNEKADCVDVFNGFMSCRLFRCSISGLSIVRQRFVGGLLWRTIARQWSIVTWLSIHTHTHTPRRSFIANLGSSVNVNQLPSQQWAYTNIQTYTHTHTPHKMVPEVSLIGHCQSVGVVSF